eukprot:Selendium_serpulae@DN5821_c1_g1_i3.p1
MSPARSISPSSSATSSPRMAPSGGGRHSSNATTSAPSSEAMNPFLEAAAAAAANAATNSGLLHFRRQSEEDREVNAEPGGPLVPAGGNSTGRPTAAPGIQGLSRSLSRSAARERPCGYIRQSFSFLSDREDDEPNVGRARDVKSKQGCFVCCVRRRLLCSCRR